LLPRDDLVILQGVAWGGMIAEFSHHTSIFNAVKMAVSGEYPCQMCRQIAEAKKQTAEPDSFFAAKLKQDLFFPVPLTFSVLREPSRATFWLTPSYYHSPVFDQKTPPPQRVG
jgi:hypothetical protein